MAKILSIFFVISAFGLMEACSGSDNSTSQNGQPRPAASVAAEASPSPGASASPSASASPGNYAVRTGTWGGEHLRLTLTASNGTTEFDCAHGTIDEPFVTDSTGHFDLRGTHTIEHGGPVHNPPNPADTHPARYTGYTDGIAQMVITVILTDTQQNVGTFNLTYGSNGHIVKCL